MILKYNRLPLKIDFYGHLAIGMICCLGATSVLAQPPPNALINDQHAPTELHWKLDLSVSTAGIGIGVGWQPNRMPWILRAQYSYMAGGFDFGVPIGANNGSKTVPTTGHVHSNFSLSHFNLLADYLLLRNENLKITIGCAYHPNKSLSVETTLRDFNFHDIVFIPSEIGKITTSISSKSKFSPYLGMAFGRSIPKPKHRIRFSADVGVYYLGNWQVDSVRIKEGIILDRWSNKNTINLQNWINANIGHQLLPNVRLMLNYLIF